MSSSAVVAPFVCDLVPDRERVIVRLEGELDLATAPRVRVALWELLEAGFPKITVDLRALTFMGSCGLALLLMMSRTARARGGQLTLIGGDNAVQRAFDATGLTEAFTFEPASGVPTGPLASRLALGGQRLRRDQIDSDGAQ